MNRAKGFTLIELVVVMAIIAILALLIIGAILAARLTARNTQRTGNARTFHTALESYFVTKRNYPGTAGTAFSIYDTATAGNPRTSLTGFIAANFPANDPSGAASNNRVGYCAGTGATFTLYVVSEPTTIPALTCTAPAGSTDFSLK